MRALYAWAIRILVVTVCGFAAVQYIRWATVDWLASTGKAEDLDRAARIDPGDEAVLARSALFRSQNDDPSPAVDEELQRAARMNPLDSEVLMALGLREELRGNDAQAVLWLTRAATVDHQFKPTWTLANYYYRANQPDKFWSMMQRCLSLDPLGFDPTPVFDLAWNETGDSKKILSLIPKKGSRPVQYLNYLINTGRVDAAFEVWPEALAAARTAVPPNSGALAAFPDFLAVKNRIPEAVAAWNQLVDAGAIASGRLDPQAGASIADPEFRFPPLERMFGWTIASNPGAAGSIGSGSLRFEFDGNEPESARLLFTVAPVLSGRRYRLVWTSDAGSLSSPTDPGLAFRIVQLPGNTATQCPLLATGTGAACEFGIQSGVQAIRIDLSYMRALGTTRIEGVLRISKIRLEFAP
jgi:tetratricopeptide (TPR) repeat protein